MAILPGNTWLPLIAALFTGLFFVGVLAKLYVVALAGAALAALTFWRWAWQGARDTGERDLLAAPEVRLPLHFTVARSPGWWGTAVALAADAALYASLLFAYLFLWTVSPAWPPAGFRDVGLVLPAVALTVLASSSLAVRARRWPLAIGLAVLAAALETGALATSGLSATAHAYGAVVFAAWGFELLHIAIAVTMAAFVRKRAALGHAHRHEPAIAALFWHYTVLQWLAGFAIVHLFPFLAA